MKSHSFILSAAALALSFSSFARADQWTDADALFVQRDAGRAKVQEARVAYQTILSGATDVQDKIRAVSQLSRLDLYEGEMLLAKSEKAERIRIFRACWETTTEAISPAAIGEKVPNYYYFKASCLAWWGESAGPLLSLPKLPLLKSLMADGMTTDTRFEGGGLHRLIAAVKSNPAARALPGLYDIVEAERQIGLALAAAAYPGDANAGNVYYENLRNEALIMVEAERVTEAKTKYGEHIAVIERAVRTRRLPRGREPESLWVLEKLKLELENLNSH